MGGTSLVGDGVDCDVKHHVSFSVEPLLPRTLSQIRREANLKYRLRGNLFHPDGRPKARWGGKPKGRYSLQRHLATFEDSTARQRFLAVRETILTGGFTEAVRKRYIAYLDDALYNRFLLVPQRHHFWLAVKGPDLREEGLHSYSDDVQTFFKVTGDVPLARVRRLIRERSKEPHPPLPRRYGRTKSAVAVSAA